MTNTEDHTPHNQIPDIEIMRWFEFDHLPPHLQAVSRPYADLARALTGSIPASQELAVALRKLLESKDAAVRAAIAGLDRFNLPGERQ